RRADEVAARRIPGHEHLNEVKTGARRRRAPVADPIATPPEKNTTTMNLTELKKKSAAEVIELAGQMGVEGIARARKQDVIFAMLKQHAKSGEDIFGDGVLEILQDGFGF